MKRYICFQLQTSEPRIRIDISAMSRRVAASPSRGRSRGRLRARKSSSSQRRQKSFEELFSDQQRVAKLRKQVQQQYPKRHVEDLVAWLDGAQSLLDARQIMRELRTWDPTPKDSDDFTLKRRQLFASREDILRSATLPEHVTNTAALDEFLGQGSVVLLVDEVDCVAAKKHHAEWFARLQAATRHSTSMVHALQTKFAEGARSLLGSEETAAFLTLQWSATDEALQAEERLLGDKTSLQVLRASVRCAVEAADELRVYLTRSKDDWSQMETFELLVEHLDVFPELALDDSFFARLADVADLPLVDGVAAGMPRGPSYAVEIKEANLRDFRLLHKNAHELHGCATPAFIVLHGKIWARYTHGGLALTDLGDKYEIYQDLLNTVWGSVASAAAAFHRHVGRQHGKIDADNIFVDVVSGRVSLGAHATSLDPDAKAADVPALTATVESFAKIHGLVFKPRRPLKLKVEFHSCFSLCSRSTTCPGGSHHFCEPCFGNLIDSTTKQNGGMPQLSCPMPDCSAEWSDVNLLKSLPTKAESVTKRRRIHLEAELRQEIRREVQAELAAAAASPQVVGGADNELHQSLITQALEILVDKCRRCGSAFDEFDGCFAITCECSWTLCGYCLVTGTDHEIHAHISSNDCAIRRHMFPDAESHTFHQGGSKDEEFSTARRIRIIEELHELFEGLASRQRSLLARRIRRDVAENGIDLALVAPDLEEEV